MPGRAPISIADAHAQLTAPGSPFEMEVVDIDGRLTKTWKNAMPSIRALLDASRAPRHERRSQSSVRQGVPQIDPNQGGGVIVISGSDGCDGAVPP